MSKPTFAQRMIKPFFRKALYDLYPELLQREPLLRINSEDQSATWNGAEFLTSASYYQTHIWVHKAIREISNNLSPLPVRVVTGEGKDTTPLPNHPLMDVLNHPNDSMTPADLWDAWVVDLMTGGEFGLEASWNMAKSKVKEFWPHQPQQFTVQPLNWRYRQVSGYTINDGLGEPYVLPPSAFIHFKFYNPLNPWRGIAPLTAARYSVVIDALAQSWAYLFFKNQARPDFGVVAPEGLTPTERKELEAELEQKFGGVNTHKPIVLEQGITDIKTFSYPPKDIEWASQRDRSRDEIAAILGVPPEIMGFGQDTYNNLANARRMLWTLTIVPLTRMRNSGLTHWGQLNGLLATRERVETDLSMVPELRDDIAAKATATEQFFRVGIPMQIVNDLLGLGLPAYDGWDQSYLPLRVTTPAVVDAGDNVSGGPAQGAAGAGQNGYVYVPARDVLPPKKTIRKGLAVYGSDEHKAIYKATQERITPFVTKLQAIVKKQFQRQQNEIGTALREGKEFGHGLHKDGDSVPSPQSVFDLEAEIKKFVDAIKPDVAAAIESIGADELAGLGLSVAFDISRPEVVAAIRSVLSTVATTTNETTWNDLVDLFQEAEQAGEGIPAILSRLSAYFGDRKSDYQTERIARTTMTASSNLGTQSAGQQAQDEGVDTNHEWISALQPGRSRETHMDAHGQIVGLNEAFNVGGEMLMYPGDPNGSPENIINCLCNEILVVKE